MTADSPTPDTWQPSLKQVANRMAYLHGELNRENPALASKYGRWLEHAYHLLEKAQDEEDSL